MKTTEVLSLLEYNYWATERVLGAAAHVSTKQFTDAPNAQTPSLRWTLVHMLWVEQLWRTRLETGMSSEPLRAEDIPDVTTLRRRWQAESRVGRASVATFDETALEHPIRFLRRTGEQSDPFKPWHMLLQLVLHSGQHRSEAAALLTTYGASPGDLDFVYFLLGRR